MCRHELQVRTADRLIEEQARILSRAVELVKDSLAFNKLLSI